MSFNFLEVEKTVRAVQKDLAGAPLKIESADLAEFHLPALGNLGLPDLNVALRLENGKSIVFSLKQPWTALFYVDSGRVKTMKAPWSQEFGSALDWNLVTRGKKLAAIETLPGDRVVKLKTTEDVEIQVELFPARPNWIVTQPEGNASRWKKAIVPGLRPMAPRPAPTGFEARTFDASDDHAWQKNALEHYARLREQAFLVFLKQKATQALQQRLAQLAKTERHMTASLKEANEAETTKAEAEALKAVLHEHGSKKGFKTAKTHLGTLELDPKLTVAENADQRFQRYKKLIRTQKEVAARFDGIKEERAKLQSSINSVRAYATSETETFLENFQRLRALIKESGVPLEKEEKAKAPDKREKKFSKVAEKFGLRKFLSKEGLSIWIGKNHKENEELVIRTAKGNDMWLHLKGQPGAHGIIQLPNGRSPSLETLLDAATLVAYYSGFEKADRLEVDYTFRKHVKRVAGTKDKFLVTYSQNKTLLVKIEEERLWRLLKQH